jgi:hypothetical protein
VRKLHPLRCVAAPQLIAEPLEGRRLLSGNVTVAFDAAGNTVNIKGDNKANEIVLSGSLGGGTYTIAGASGTRVNGQSSVTLPVVGANGSNFRISLGNGDDVVRLGSISPDFVPFTANSLRVDTGNGDDSVLLADVTLRGGGLNVATGNGDDTVRLDFSDIFGGQTINTGNGDDTVSFGDEVNVVTGISRIDAGRGFDTLVGRGNLDVASGMRREMGFE